MASALDGITVLDLTDGPAGSLTTMFLCDHGARVIRVVDSSDTTSRRGGHLVWDWGKECIRLDFSQIVPRAQSAQEVLPMREQRQRTRRSPMRGSCVTTNVLVENFAPSSRRRAIVFFGWLSALNPRLIHCSITAYGKYGPLKAEPPIDDLVMARMGILGSQPGFRPPPVHVVHPLPSVGAAIRGAGHQASLLAREKTGLGRQVDTSLMAGALMYHPKVVGDKLLPNVFQTHPSGSGAFYSVYECADSNWVQLGCVHVGFVATAATVMGIKDAVNEPRFNRGRPPQDSAEDRDLRALVAQVIRTKPYAESAIIFDAADVPFAQARLTEESMDDPQVAANGMVIELQDPEVGPLFQMGVPIELSATPGKVKGPRVLPNTQPGRVPDDLPDIIPASHNQPPHTGLFDPPLKGIRVLEITNLIAGPNAGRLLLTWALTSSSSSRWMVTCRALWPHLLFQPERAQALHVSQHAHARRRGGRAKGGSYG